LQSLRECLLCSLPQARHLEVDPEASISFHTTPSALLAGLPPPRLEVSRSHQVRHQASPTLRREPSTLSSSRTLWEPEVRAFELC
jgi:hypothetical protein